MKVTITRPRSYQREAIEAMKAAGCRNLLADEMGLGKFQPLDAKVLTPTGWVLMGQIQIGDVVIGADGKLHSVTGVFPQGEQDVYKVSFSDGSSTRCGLDHLWMVNTPLRKSRGSLPKVLTLRQIMDDGLRNSSGNLKHFIPVVSAVEFYRRENSLPAYLVGYLIANGGLTTSIPYVSIPDQETVLRIGSLLPGGVSIIQASGYDYRLTSGGTRSNRNPLTEALERLSLMGKPCYRKSIPFEYRFSSLESRRNLLKGLMDGDGSVSKADNHLEYTTASSQLADDVVGLVQSLGGTARINIKEEPKYTYKGETNIGRRSFRVSIALPSKERPFLLSRKADQYHPREKYQPSRAIVEIKYLGKQECQCITVDSPDHLYVTDDYIVTHNSLEILRLLWDLPEIRPALLVVPAHLKVQWQREAWKHCRLRTEILSTTKVPRSKTLNEGIAIINYEILNPWMEFLLRCKFKFVAADEGHYIGNIHSRRSRLFAHLCKAVPHIIVATGTPLLNDPWELYPILSVLWPEEFDSPFSFAMDFCEDIDRDFGKWRFRGAKNLKKLHRILTEGEHPKMIRRTKEQVLDQLPPIRHTVIPMEIEDRRQYDRAEDDIIAWLSEFDLAAAGRAAKALRFTKFSYLRALSATLKLKYAMDWLDSFLRESDGKILVGCIHRTKTPILPRLWERYAKIAVQFHGGMTQVQRQEAEGRFKKDRSVRMMLAQEQAAGTGLNLPEASTVAVVELPWTAGAVNQFIGRAHRLTSTGQVDAYFFPAIGTIEEKMCEILQRKSKIVSRVLDGGTDRECSLNIFDQLHLALLEKAAK